MISKLLKDTRKHEKVTLKQLSEKTGNPLSYISRIESGANVSFKTAENLFLALGYKLKVQIEKI